MDKNLINALARLERAGAENSKATKKLHEAATTIAVKIEECVPVGVDLPRGYKVVRRCSNIGADLFLLDSADRYIDGTGGYLHRDFHCKIPPQTRVGSLQFAKDVSEGLLDEIAAWLEERVATVEQAAKTLEAHGECH
jgi:hypothetical protein